MAAAPLRLAGLLAIALLLAAGCVRPEFREAAAVQLPPPFQYHGGWPLLDEAPIRPGVRIQTPLAQGTAECTSNFLFRTADNATLYLGLAAHCFGTEPSEAAPVGTRVDIVGADGNVYRGAARIAYNGWAHDPGARNDFGLVELRSDPLVRSKVHPAMLHFGGPTGLADGAALTPGTHVIAYGHSGQRAADDPDNPREGYVLQNQDGLTTVVTDHPGIQGDSGTGMMTSDGLAAGVLSMGTTNPTGGLVANRDFPSVNYYVTLDQALAAARAADPALATLEVVTAPRLAPAELPL